MRNDIEKMFMDVLGHEKRRHENILGYSIYKLCRPTEIRKGPPRE
jgi:hypothetical protein